MLGAFEDPRPMQERTGGSGHVDRADERQQEEGRKGVHCDLHTGAGCQRAAHNDAGG